MAETPSPSRVRVRDVAGRADTARGTASGTRRDTSARPTAARAAAAAHTALAVQAMQLLGRWQRVRNGHLTLGAGCACSIGASVDLREFDDLILDYLLNKFAADAALHEFICQGAHASAGQDGSLMALLRGIAAAPSTLPAARVTLVLQALESSIASIEEQHP